LTLIGAVFKLIESRSILMEGDLIMAATPPGPDGYIEVLRFLIVPAALGPRP